MPVNQNTSRMKNTYSLAKAYAYRVVAFLFALMVLIPGSSSAQLVQQIESFESATIFPAPGWRQLKAASNISGAFVLQPVASSTNPAIAATPLAGGGANVMMLNSFTANLNDTSYMITKPFDFSNNAGTNPEFSLSIFRDNGFALADDHIRVYVNTVPSITGATLLTNAAGFDKVSRYNSTAPAVAANSWYSSVYQLPAATYNQRRYYFIIMGVCKDGNNMYLDRVTANTYPTATLAADVKLNITQQNGASVGTGVNNHMIIGIKCVIAGNSGCGVVNGAASTAVKLDSLLFNTNGTTNVLNIDDAKVYYTGGSPLFDTTYVSPFPVTAGSDDYPARRYGSTIAVPGTNLDFTNAATSCFYLEYDTTYFWLTYDIKATATGGNFVDADFRGGAVGGTPGQCPSPGGTGLSVVPDPGGFSLLGASQIDLPYCVGTYTVGTSWLNGSYTNNDYVQSATLIGALGTLINTNIQGGMPASQPSNNNTGLPSNLPCLLSNGGPGCDFTAFPPSYELWPSVLGRTVVLTQGVNYSITVQAGTWVSANNIAVFIDYNRDGDFSDAGEKLGQVNCNANQSLPINFLVPAVGYTGVTRMRIREVWAVSNIDPCLQYTYGEIEDFQIVISPSCSNLYKLWLGNTDDWNNPGNWCGGVPTYTDSAVVSRNLVFGGPPSRPYFKPTIKSNVSAVARGLSISNLDTLVVNAPTPATRSLRVSNDIVNNGRIEVIGGFNTSVTYSNGTLVNNVYTPFKTLSSDARTQIVYSQSELTLAGLVAGDQITGIQFDISFKGSNAAFSGFTISYALVPNGYQHPVAPNPAPFAGPFTTVYGPINFSTALGTNTINLTTPIIWNGSNNLLIQYCFDNAGNIGSNDDRINITQTTGIRSTLIYSTTTNAASGCVLAPGAGVTDNFYSALNSFRPNFTFLVKRPYAKAIMAVREDWVNNGAFSAGYSRVVMDSTIAAQTIGGTSITKFNELQLNKASLAQTVTNLRPVEVDTSLILTQGAMLMNGQTLTMFNPAVSGGTIDAPTGPFERTNGALVSENAAAFVIWKNITTVGNRIVPFGSAAVSPLYIPFSFTHNSGVLGDLSVATYNAPGNLPFPPTVTHINTLTTSTPNNANATVDRFWMLGKTGANPGTSVTFRFTAAERAAGMSTLNQGRAQPWWALNQNRAWIRLTSPSTSLTYTQNYGQRTLPSAFDSVRVVNFDWPTLPAQGTAPFFSTGGPLGNLNPWAISTNSSPLPVELVDFNAKAIGNRVRLSWSTASEINNDYFTIERTNQEATEFSFIDKVNSYMNNSTMLLNYETWDDQPIAGLQYYRLKQTDLDGQETYSELRPVHFGNKKSFEITNVFGNTTSSGLFMVDFIYNSELPLSAIITDASGRVLYKQDGVNATPGINRLELNTAMPRGMYFIILQNQEEKVNRKFIY